MKQKLHYLLRIFPRLVPIRCEISPVEFRTLYFYGVDFNIILPSTGMLNTFLAYLVHLT